MPEEQSKNFDQIKPFIRMLEGSIEEARARRLAREGGPDTSSPPARRVDDSARRPDVVRDAQPGEDSSANASAQGNGEHPAARRREGSNLPLATPKRTISNPENKTDDSTDSPPRFSSLATPNYRL